jgi:hypothetical protein
MCKSRFPSFTKAQIANGDVASSLYASAFAGACQQLVPALSRWSPDDYLLVFGLPVPLIPFPSGLSVCYIVRPGCGDGGEQSMVFVLSQFPGL